MIGNARGSHSSPGIYTKEIDLSYASKSLGITTLGVVGETLKGPAFEPIKIENWREFVDYFGGTSAEKFKGSQYPKYELPYIAKSYLKNSNQLEVCRVLGLSGYNAGPAWLITAANGKGKYEEYGRTVSTFSRVITYHKDGSTNFSINDYNDVEIGMFFTVNGQYGKITKITDTALIFSSNNIALNFSKDDVIYFYNNPIEKTISTDTQTSNTEYTLTDVTGIEIGDVIIKAGVGSNFVVSKIIAIDTILKKVVLSEEVNFKQGDTLSIYNNTQFTTVDKIPSTTYLGNFVTKDGSYYEWVPEDANEYVLAVLRSRGSYEGNGQVVDVCSSDSAESTYDRLTYFTNSVTFEPYTSASVQLECKNGEMTSSEVETDVNISVRPSNYGRFTIVVNGEKRYAVSLNPGDKDYIFNVLGSTPSDGTSLLYVEELYDVAYMQMVDANDITLIKQPVMLTDGLNMGSYNPITPSYDPVFGIKDENLELGISHVGLTFLDVENAKIVKVVATKDANGRRTYEYVDVDTMEVGKAVFVMSEDRLYVNVNNKAQKLSTDINDYKEQFRCASTPWVVSELKGDSKSVEVRKLFRFHTISDGNGANSEVKVSIQNIRPDEGLFDVVIRKFDDMDSSPAVLERFAKCSMVPGTNNFIGFKIGTFDGEYIVKSKYVTVEVNTNETTETCIPAGFLGYPMREYVGVSNMPVGYNRFVDDDIKPKKQYFGFSNITGIDVDVFAYKGRNAYDNINSLSKGFHLDSRIESLMGDEFSIKVDGEEGYDFVTVSPNNITGLRGGITPKIGSEAEMVGTIYEDVNLRKFTVCFYGGFDGWDPYRSERTNTDKFKANKYKGQITNGAGSNFSQILDPSSLNLVGNCINSDYYAYLAGARQFENIEAVDINVFATPGIDYVNQGMLSKEILSMIEEERGDTLYVMTTPDAPAGQASSLYYPDEVVSNLEDAEIDSSYATTYYPWVKYYDADNSVYINLPATKDALASMAYTDNVSYPWFAPAGTVRGAVECERAAYITKLEDEDVLYSGRINPIKTFAADGVKIWGQKTMYDAETPLNRINVRRLMLRIKKLIKGACIRLIFEQNDATVKTQFESLVKPILDDIKAKRGIYDYKLEVNDSAEARDRMELPAVIYIKPTKALEYISIDFVIMPESVAFNE